MKRIRFSANAMAICTKFTCDNCGIKIESWSDGKPYLRGPDGKRHYFYHPGERYVWERRYEAETGCPAPDHETLMAFVRTRVGNEGHYLCMHCGEQTWRDSHYDPMICTSCGKSELFSAPRLENQNCPKCRTGIFKGKFTAIS